MRRIPRAAFFLPAILLFCRPALFPANGAEKSCSYHAALESITAHNLGQYVGHLASPELEGREAGTRGGKAAGDYLAEHYKHLHLRGGGDGGGFFQPFDPDFRNVLALLPGSDAKLRDQLVIVCAHYDHIGYGGRGLSLDAYGEVHPGADDNASGTSAVLELARAMTLLAEPPKRSILFANWDAEEKGLLGSKHWTAQPTLPLDHVVAGLNLDMVGRLRDNHLILFGTRSGYGWRRLLSRHNQAGFKIDFPWELKANADHYPLFEQNIPVLLFHTGMHDNYHRASDLAKFINTDGMREIDRMLFSVVYELANTAATPAFRATAREDTPEAEREFREYSEKPADRLGISWSEDAALAGGVVLSSVAAGSPAERAGLRPGDRIVQFGARKIRSDDDFYGAVSAAASPATMLVERPGKGKPLVLAATLAGDPLRWGMMWRLDDAEPGTVILTHVVRGSAAARAGLAVGDRIYQVGGRNFADESAFVRLTKTPADSLPLLVERDGRLRSVTLQSRQTAPLRRAA
jgi:hypothetical protein